MIMVDEVRPLPGARAPFRAGACHMTTDGQLPELHGFAEALGLPRGRFRADAAAPRYDLTSAEQTTAIGAGAVFVPAANQARVRRLARFAAQGREFDDVLAELDALLREAGARPYINTACLDEAACVKLFQLRARAWLAGKRVAVRHVDVESTSAKRRRRR